MIQFIKITAIYCLRIVLRLFSIFPINERKIVFVSWMGRQYACNPKYIFEYMYNHYADKYIYVWSLRDKKKLPNNFVNVRICGYFTLKYMYSVMTSKYLITNQGVEPCFPFRKKQNIIYTWHGGGAYKKQSSDIKIYNKQKWSKSIMRGIRSKMITYAISSCKKFTEIYCDIWDISQNHFLAIGMPRNDVLFYKNDKINEKVYKFFDIDSTKMIILYAPTFRGNFRLPKNMDCFQNLDVEMVLKSIKNKYKKDFIFLYRTHYNIYNNKMNTSNGISASDYPDMQELLYAADILITDYSSSIWDFSFTFKPCFIYAPDLKKYKEEQGFYTPIEEWPFPIAETNEQLVKIILDFDGEKYTEAVKKHHTELGSYDDGTACEKFYHLVFDSAAL